MKFFTIFIGNFNFIKGGPIGNIRDGFKKNYCHIYFEAIGTPGAMFRVGESLCLSVSFNNPRPF